MVLKNKIGMASGFVIGLAGFLLMFKLFLLDNIPREDEVPPGIVVVVSILNGSLFANAGYSIQNYLKKSRN